MKEKWPWLFAGAALAVALALAGILSEDCRDFALGLAAGLAIGGIFSWFAERHA